MLGKLAQKLTQYLLRKNIITLQQTQWCCYILHKKLISFMGVCILVAIGTVLASLPPALTFTLGVLFLRQRTNGYHASTECGCLLVSVVMEAGAMLLLPCFVFESYLTVLLGAVLCVLMLAPINNGQIHLTDTELAAMRWRAYLRTGLVAAVSLLLWYGSFTELAVSLCLAILGVCLSLAAATLGFGIQ